MLGLHDDQKVLHQDFDFTEEVRGLQVPTLIACADADMAPPSHYVKEGRPKGGHALAIIPGETHYSIFASPVLAAAALSFLDASNG